MAVLRIHDVTLISPARVLDDLAVGLATTQTATLTAPLAAAVEVHVGRHCPDVLAKPAPARPPTLRIGLQTEHILDAGGMPLWQSGQIGTDQAQVAHHDVILNLSPPNHEMYDALPPNLRARIDLEPQVFPAAAPPFAPVSGGPMMFFGGPTPRRQRRFAKLQGHGLPVTIPPHATFGANLWQELTKAATLPQILFAPARYTKAPRILTAIPGGKLLIWEELALPFLEGAHSLTLTDAKASDAALQTSYEALASLCAQHSLPGVLKAVLLEKGLAAP